jgi:hypothetical protein
MTQPPEPSLPPPVVPPTVAPPTVPPPPSPEPAFAWRPARDRERNVASMIVGLVLLAIGVWYFLDQTLGITMPRIRWADVWPVFLIVIGAFILIRSAARRS